ncbi:MAG: lysophospholipase [Candidatus Omnitrophica bacterium]|nr:lysophospholipase [Candidatus Omnitrophota bacterium]
MPGVTIREAHWSSPITTHALFYRLYHPTPQSRGLVVLIHGFGEHGGRYNTVASRLAQRGWSVACVDLWGHGRSGGQRGGIERFADYFDDLEALVTTLWLPATSHDRYALLGHSFGGLLAMAWAIRGVPSGCRCLVVQSPLLGVGYSVPTWKTALASGLAKVWPRLSLPIGLDPTWLTHDGEVIRRYRTDPLIHRRITLQGYLALQSAMQRVREEAYRINLPTLMMYGTADRVISLATCQEVFERLQCVKRLKVFEGCYHELHFESVQAQVIDEITTWMSVHH